MIEKEIELSTSPVRVFEVLTTSTQFSELTGGAPAELSAESGAAFSLFGGMIEGRNVEAQVGTRLVQAWRPKNWEPGSYSLVRMELSKSARGTKLSLTQVGYPEDQEQHLSDGWEANYLAPLKKLFA